MAGSGRCECCPVTFARLAVVTGSVIHPEVHSPTRVSLLPRSNSLPLQPEAHSAGTDHAPTHPAPDQAALITWVEWHYSHINQHNRHCTLPVPAYRLTG